MAISDYPDFLTTDTMNQQVTKLVEFVADVDSNNTSIIENIADFTDIYSVETLQFAFGPVTFFKWNYDVSNGVVTTDGLTVQFNATTVFDVNGGVVDIAAITDAKFAGENIHLNGVGPNSNITLESRDNLSNIILNSNGSTYGLFRDNDTNLTIGSGVNDVIILDGSNSGTDATFTGTITLPSSSVTTTAKDVAGAINELNSLISSLQIQVNNLTDG